MQSNNKQRNKPTHIQYTDKGCTGFVEIPTTGKHPVMQIDKRVAASLTEEQIANLNKKFNTSTNTNQTEETTMENKHVQANPESAQTAQTTNPSAQQTCNNRDAKQGSIKMPDNMVKALTENEDTTVATQSTDKLHWAIAAGAGAVIGATVNFDKGLTVMVTAATLGAAATATVNHFVEERGLYYGLAAAAVVGVGVRLVQPILLQDRQDTDEFLLNLNAPVAASVASTETEFA